MKNLLSKLVFSCAAFAVAFSSVGQVACAGFIEISTYTNAFERGSNPAESNANMSSSNAPTSSYLEYSGNAGYGYGRAIYSSSDLSAPALVNSGGYAYGNNVDGSAEAYGYAQLGFMVSAPTPFYFYDYASSDPGGNSRGVLYGYNLAHPSQVINYYYANYSGVIYKDNNGYVTGTLLPGWQYFLYSSSYSIAAAGKTSVHTSYARLYTGVAPNVLAVPEPSSLALLGLGGLGTAIGAYRRRRQAV